MIVRNGRFSHKAFLFIMFTLLAIVVVDTSIVKVYDLVDKFYLPADGKLVVFCIVSFGCVLLQCFIVNYLRKSISKITGKTIFSRFFNIIPVVSLIAIGALFVALAFQQFYYGYYNKILPILVIDISYVTATALVLRLGALFISWYRSQSNIIILLYFLSMCLIGFSIITTALTASLKINERPEVIREFVGGSADIYVGRFVVLDYIYAGSTIVSFISIWITTAILMNYYRDKLVSTVRYWILISIPLIYFLINYFYTSILDSVLVSYRLVDPVGAAIVFTTFLTLSKPIGGLTFGIAFWKISRDLRYERNVSTYMVVSGWGMLLVFGANQAISQVLYPYPPFGLATTSVMVLAAYLMLIGIYNSAILVSASADLRKTVYKHALQSKLLGPIGRAEVDIEVQKTVDAIIREKDISEVDTEPKLELDANELSRYLELVGKELKKNKKTTA